MKNYLLTLIAAAMLAPTLASAAVMEEWEADAVVKPWHACIFRVVDRVDVESIFRAPEAAVEQLFKPAPRKKWSDPEKGSGAAKVTPAHDFNDFEIGNRHSLPRISVLDQEGRAKPRQSKRSVSMLSDEFFPPVGGGLPPYAQSFDGVVYRRNARNQHKTQN